MDFKDDDRHPIEPDKQPEEIEDAPLPAIAGFNYGDMSPDNIAFLKEQAAEIREMGRQGSRLAIAVGIKLLDIKNHRLRHGQFNNWVKAECGYSKRTAERYMAAAKLAAGKNDTVSHLSPGVLYQIAAKNAPKEIVGEVLARVDKGETINEDEIKERLKAARLNRKDVSNLNGHGERAERKPTMKEQLEEAKGKITEQQKKLEAAQNRDGSLFDLLKDRLDDIADTIIRVAGENRAKGLVTALNKRLKKAKPAG